jgi:hypothetical protein
MLAVKVSREHGFHAVDPVAKTKNLGERPTSPTPVEVEERVPR